MKILSLDGGGVFGIFAANILDNVDTNRFDAIIGTSIGSFIGAIIATGLNVKLTKIFHKEMPKIFSGFWYKRFSPICPRYSDRAINNSLRGIFDGMAMRDVKIPLFITSVQIQDERLKVFYSGCPDDGTRMLWELVRSSTAAPTYFAPFNGFVDGGIYCNTPSVAGIAGLCSECNCNVEDIEVCSIGTGEPVAYNHVHQWLYPSWGMWLLNAMLNGSSGTMNNFITKSLPVKKFLRIQPLREKSWDMDSVSDMHRAELAWKDDIKRGIDNVTEFLKY